MGVRAFVGAILDLGLSVLLATWSPAQAQGPQPPPAVVPSPKARAETPAQAARRLAEQLKRHPAQPSQLKARRGLYLLDLVEGDVTMIADEPDPGANDCGSPRWSHDGRRIIFDVMPAQNFPLLRIKVIEVGEQGPSLIDLGLGARPSFSPDDQRIAFLLHDNAEPRAEPGIWVMQADGSGRRFAGELVEMPLWSPDGRQFLIVGFPNPGGPSNPREMTLIDLEKPELRPIKIPGYQIFAWPTWADVGTVAAIIGAAGAGDTVALLDVSHPEQPKVKEVLWKRGKELDVQPLWPVYSVVTHRCVFVGVGPQGMALYSVEPGQAGRAKRLERGGFDRQIGGLWFSPDGRYLLFCSRRPNPMRP